MKQKSSRKLGMLLWGFVYLFLILGPATHEAAKREGYHN